MSRLLRRFTPRNDRKTIMPREIEGLLWISNDDLFPQALYVKVRPSNLEHDCWVSIASE